MEDVLQAAVTASVLAAVYCLPMIVAIRYRHCRRKAITALNLLLGWTLVGWVIALLWASRWRGYRRYVSRAAPNRADS